MFDLFYSLTLNIHVITQQNSENGLFTSKVVLTISTLKLSEFVCMSLRKPQTKVKMCLRN